MAERDGNQSLRTFTGGSDRLSRTLAKRISQASGLDIVVSFLKYSGVKILIDALKAATGRGVTIRILTGTYLGITEPFALKVLMKELGDRLDLRLYSDTLRSFHPKAWFFRINGKLTLMIGSSNLSKSALEDGVEWNYELDELTDKKSVESFHREFERLFQDEAIKVDAKVLSDYEKTWTRPAFATVSPETTGVLPQPREAQEEALYALKESREEGADKALVYAATGIGKTYLAAFDSRPYARVLFVAHRQEILNQAEEAFRKVRPECSTGFFTAERKDMGADIIFASVATIANRRHLGAFRPDSFDYIIIDEFHHAVAQSYQSLLKHFKSKFLLGLTASAERMDRQDIYSLCDYNVPYRLTLADAINRGFLSPFHYFGVYDDTVDYSQVASSNGHYVARQLTRSLSTSKRAELIFKNYCKYHSRRALGFTSTRQHAIYMAECFTQFGTNAVAVVSGNRESDCQMDRQEAVTKLEGGQVAVIFCVDMFNEGLDVPSIDLVMFLRPTESPIVFLQQLGRGLRRSEGKDHVDVLDFIGNYNNAYLIPGLLTRTAEVEDSTGTYMDPVPRAEDLPQGCIVDFDFRLIDLFHIMRERELTVKDKVVECYQRTRQELGHAPSRCEFFEACTGNEIALLFHSKMNNPFRDYVDFLKSQGEDIDEDFISSPATSLIKAVENTSMTKSYKLPVLLAFVEGDGLKDAIDDRDIVRSFKAFYSTGRNFMDMERDMSTKSFRTWSDTKILLLAKDNPVHFLAKSTPEIFHIEDGRLHLTKRLGPWLEDKRLLFHFLDAIMLRRLEYYWKRYERGMN